MLSGIFFLNLKGDIIIQRFFRDDVSQAACNSFREQAVIKKTITKPIVIIDGVSFLYTRQNDVFIVACTRKNANPFVAFEFMIAIVSVFAAYFGKKFVEDAIINNFVVVYELLDEMMDNGHPQLTAINHLKGAIALGSIKGNAGALDAKTGKQLNTITSFITGGVDWREPGKYVYKHNEVYMDVLEAVNVLVSQNDQVLRSDVSGKIVFRTYLTGFPLCQFGLNDKLRINDKDSNRNNNRGNNTTGGNNNNNNIAIDDITFHRCVQLAQFEQERVVSFVPPDGEFVLMKYRIANNVALPFALTRNVLQRGRTRVEYNIIIKGNFDPRLTAHNVKIIIPTPPNTAETNIKTTAGKAGWKDVNNHIVWRIPRFTGNSTYSLTGEAILTATIEDKPWNRPPINVEFQVPMFTASGVMVRFLRVTEASQYTAVKWVRYVTRNGNYQLRI